VPHSSQNTDRTTVFSNALAGFGVAVAVQQLEQGTTVVLLLELLLAGHCLLNRLQLAVVVAAAVAQAAGAMTWRLPLACVHYAPLHLAPSLPENAHSLCYDTHCMQHAVLHVAGSEHCARRTHNDKTVLFSRPGVSSLTCNPGDRELLQCVLVKCSQLQTVDNSRLPAVLLQI
jgi:hypothetical protein